MSKDRLKQFSAADIRASINAAKSETRCNVLKELCPCRNQVYDIDVWREIFRAARDDNRRTRHRAAHAIATLLQKSQTSARWRDLLQRLDADLERLMEKPDSAGPLLGQIAHQAGHAHTLRGSAVQTYRYQRRALDLTSREALTDWVNAKLGLRKHSGVASAQPGAFRASPVGFAARLLCEGTVRFPDTGGARDRYVLMHFDPSAGRELTHSLLLESPRASVSSRQAPGIRCFASLSLGR